MKTCCRCPDNKEFIWCGCKCHNEKTGFENRATWELKNMIKANSFLAALNTPEEDERLALMKRELKTRKYN